MSNEQNASTTCLRSGDFYTIDSKIAIFIEFNELNDSTKTIVMYTHIFS